MIADSPSTGGPRVDLEALLAPLEGDNPAGVQLLYEGTYDEVREARREDDPTLPQGVWKSKLKKADWRQVEALCVQALGERSKDLQIAVWLAEAWTRLHRVSGLSAGLTLLKGLCEAFWEEMYPALEEDDLEARLAPLEWMNDKLTIDVLMTPITEGGKEDGSSYSWGDWQVALHSEPTEGPDEPDRIGRADVLAQVTSTSSSFYKQLGSELGRAGEALTALRQTLVARCGGQAPSMSQLGKAVEEMTHFVHRILKERKEIDKDAIVSMVSTVAEPKIASADEPSDAGGAPVEGPIASRAMAYQMLVQAADYLQQTEPHSPAPYLVRRAIAWGQMSLAELLRELLRENADLGTVYRLLGIKQGEFEPSEGEP